MTYKYSICYPDKENIEYPAKLLGKEEVLDMAQNYPWIEQLKLSDSLTKKIYYSPSIDFTHIKDEHSFCLTAGMNKDRLEFSIWYNRPVKTKPLFGLLGEKIKLRVVDKWSFDKQTALKHLETFLNQDYRRIERIMTE